MGLAVDDQDVLAIEACKAGQELLELAWKDVFAAYDEHVIGATLDPQEASVRAATGARLGGEHCPISCAVAQHRRRLTTEACQHQLTRPPFLKWRPGIWVHDFRIEVVFENVQAIMPAALGSHTGASQLRQPIDVEGFQAEVRLNLAPQAFAPGLRAEDPDPKPDALTTFQPTKSFGQNQRV